MDGCYKNTVDELKVSDTFFEKLQYCRDNIRKESNEVTGTLHPTLVVIYEELTSSERFAEHKKILSLNIHSLKRCCLSFWADVLRVKGYHPIEYPDGHKLAAYMFKWLNRFRPIEFTDVKKAPIDIKNYLLNINGVYSINCALSMPGLHIGCLKSNELKSMLYTAMYRDIHADEWAWIFYLLENLHPSADKPVPLGERIGSMFEELTKEGH